MKKIDSSTLVCTATQSQQLIGLGILPIGCMCYESVGGVWEFSGEYMGQSPVIPAWSMEELNILIGGDFPQIMRMNERQHQAIMRYPKPDLYRQSDWTYAANMMKYILHLPLKRVETLNGAEAYATLLYQLLVTKEITADACNARLEAFVSKEIFNPQTEVLEKEKADK